MVQVTNISGGQIVCDLKSGATLRINNKQSQTINDNEVTDYLKTLEKKGLMKFKTLTDEQVEIKKTTSKKSSSKAKEE
jgi:hypothetical protein